MGGSEIRFKKKMDRILIRDLRVRCIIGTDDRERREKQDVIVNIALTTDLSKPAATDRLEDAVNFYEVGKNIIAMVEKSDFRLIETLAERVAELCLENPAVVQVRVTLDKPGALKFAKSAAVEITRGQTK